MKQQPLSAVQKIQEMADDRLKPGLDAGRETGDRPEAQDRAAFQAVSRSSILWPSLVVLGLYGLLTSLMTWPAVLYIGDGIPGDGFDGWQNYWNLWWVKQALLVEGVNPFFTRYLDAPTGVSLLFHTLNIFNGLWTLPIQLNFGLAPAYNSVVLFSFVLSGYGGYLLALDLLARLFPGRRGLRGAAFVGGLIFTMSPFHMAHLLGHMQVFNMVWPPFYMLWLLRTLEPRSLDGNNRLRTGRGWRRNIGLSSLFLILASLVAWYHTLYLLIFTGLALLWSLWRRWRLWTRRSQTEATITSRSGESLRESSGIWLFLQPALVVCLIGLSFSIVLSPILGPMILDASSRPDLETGLVQNITLSADLLAFITPSEMHPLWGAWAKSLAERFSSTTSERLIFTGYLPLALAVFFAIRRRANALVRFWVLMVLAFFILALGPYLHIGGQIVTVGGRQMPLPYLLLYDLVPFLNLTRSLSRYDLMIMLGLGVLAAGGVVQLVITNERLVNKKWWGGLVRPAARFLAGRAYLVSGLAAILICFEFLAVPYPVSKIDVPQFYYDLAAEPGDFIIAELPMNWDRPTPLLHQTVHGKRLLTAYTSRTNPRELSRRVPVFQHWRNLGPDIIAQPPAEIAPTIFFDFNLRYIVLDYWQMPPGPEREGTERWVAAALPEGYGPVYDDGRLKVYRTPDKEVTRPYLSLGSGWGERREEAGFASRTIAAGPAELFLHHPQGQPISLAVTAGATGDDIRRLAIFANDQPVGELEIRPDFGGYSVSLPAFEDDLIRLSLQPDASEGIVVREISLTQDEGL